MEHKDPSVAVLRENDYIFDFSNIKIDKDAGKVKLPLNLPKHKADFDFLFDLISSFLKENPDLKVRRYTSKSYKEMNFNLGIKEEMVGYVTVYFKKKKNLILA